VFLRSLVAAGALALLPASMPDRAHADLQVRIDKSAQRMTVSVDGEPRHAWTVSTGRAGFGTPNGRFRAQWLARSWFSRKYYNSPMPHSIFFPGGFAIHGTNYISRLGGPASHGCVRLHPGNAATLFALVKQHGTGNTAIIVTGANATQIARRSGARLIARWRDDEPRAPRAYRPDRTFGYLAGTARQPAYYDVYSRAPIYYRAPAPGWRSPYRNPYWD